MERTRLTLRLPADLAQYAATLAEHQGLTVNAFMVQAVRNWADYHGKRLARDSAATLPPDRPGRKADTSAPLRKTGPNQPCPCGSGQKYKRCHGRPAAA